MQRKFGDLTMFRKIRIAFCVAIAFGVGATAALANDNSANTGETGGSAIGPLGQCFVPPKCGQEGGSRGGPNGFAYVPARAYHHHRDWRAR